jgi:putative peptide zinc metalloprotease protein
MATTTSTRDVPRLAPDIDLIGEYQGSGYREPHYMARRPDGQILQLSHLLFLIASDIDGERDWDEIAAGVSDEYGRQISGEQVASLVDDKLRPIGVVADAGGEVPATEKVDPLLALRYRAKVVPASVVRRVAARMHWLFWPPVVVAVVAGWAASLGWLLFVHGIGQSLREALYEPAVFLLVLGLIVASAAFHELGHAVACSYSGGTPGVMGAGIYVAWPAFYTDVTDAYRLDRRGRLRTDLGGVYCNALFSVATFAVYVVTGWEPLLLVVLVQQGEMLHQLLPLLRLDGYYILADLTGVPDLFRRVRPILSTLRPGHDREPLVDELKPRVRVAVTVWVLVVVPLLLLQLVLLVAHLPRIFATSWDSMRQQFDAIGNGFDGGSPLSAVAGVAQVLALAIPLLGITLTLYRVAKRAVGAIAKRPVLRVVAAIAGIAAFAYWLWPGGDYEPIGPDERWRVQDMVSAAFDGGVPAAAAPAVSPSVPPPSSTPPGRSPSTTRPEGPPAAPPPPAPSPRITLPAVTLPVTLPEVTVPGVTVPPVTVPPATVPPTVVPTTPPPTLPTSTTTTATTTAPAPP